MIDSGNTKLPYFKIECYILALGVLWTIVIAGSLVWQKVHIKQISLDTARIQARTIYERDILFREWMIKQSLIYVPVTGEIQHDPYLSHIPERDIMTASGKFLTLLNHPYIMRKVYELAKKKHGVTGHLTSLHPIRPENAPDAWETRALQAFERGESEISSVGNMEGENYMRLMRPLITEQACLKCHFAQGHREGDIRGGISISIPMEPLWAMANMRMQEMFAIHGMFWLFGIVGIVLAKHRMRRIELERKRAEEALQKSRDELEIRVEERTAELAKANEELKIEITERIRAEEEKNTLQDQLRQSQKMEAIGQLTGGVAHDFNNLLTVIKGYSQLSLMELNEGNPLRGKVEEIQKAADRAASLTRQLLAFSRRQVMEMKVLDLNILIKDLEKMLHRIIVEDIELFTILAEDLGRVKADPGQIEQVIMNLAVNAKDAMPNGGKLVLETANVELDETYARNHVAVTPDRYVMLAVSDTGVGMTPEIKEKVFEPFFTTKKKGEGTGLGLSTVYGIVKQSGGNIWVYSELGKGTTLKIYLPRVDEPPEEMVEKVMKEDFPRGSETILIVEDNEEVRKLAMRVLEKQGYNVLEASNGDDALHLPKERKESVHLILVDVVMPGISGRQFVEQFKEVSRDCKVLYMSGYTENGIVHHGVLGKGMNYIQKPFTIEGLTRKVREVLDE